MASGLRFDGTTPMKPSLFISSVLSLERIGTTGVGSTLGAVRYG
jgi:hypothetical protein